MSSSNQQTIDTYNKHIDEYISGSPQAVDGDLKKWVDTRFSQIDKSARILEIGTGTGKDADYLEKKGFSIERTDASEGFIKLLKNNGKKAHLLNILTDDFNGPYDVVFADAVLLHFSRDELTNILKKIYGALKLGGQLFFTLKQGDGEEITDRKMGGKRYFCYWQPNGIKHVLEAKGFASIEINLVEDYRKDRPGWLLVSAEKAKA